MKKRFTCVRRLAVLLFLIMMFEQYNVAQTITMPYIISNNMVLQQNTLVSIWGWAAAGTIVDINAGWGVSAKDTAGTDNKWLVKIKTPVAVAGEAPTYTITISGPANTITYSNILVGEVWICGGQSNMSFSMGPCGESATGVYNSAAEISQATYPNIRLFRVPNANALTPQTNTTGGSWSACSPSSVTNFSAVAYYFGRQLHTNLNIPVGLVEDCYSGSAIQAWIKQDVLMADAGLKAKYIDTPPAAADVNRVEMYPYKLYNAMIAPVIPYTMKGVIWYQGESNASDGVNYTNANIALMRDWRKDWGFNFSFYAVQLSPRGGAASYGRAIFREMQNNITSEYKTGTIVISDLLLNATELTNAHPTRKKEVGARLGLMALAKDYAQSVLFQGPVYKSKTISGNKITISYTTATLGSGLNTNDGTYVKCFKIAGSDQKFYPAMAVISGSTVVVWSDNVSAPVAVRYAVADGAMTNLQNIEGLPVFPFRTDTWSSPTYVDMPDPMPPTAVERVNMKSLSMFPNPCSDVLNISGLMVGDQRVEIFDMTGQIVKSQSGNEVSNAKTDISKLSKGAYFLKIYQNEINYECLKVLKQ